MHPEDRTHLGRREVGLSVRRTRVLLVPAGSA
jgi:hypothetical protein